MSRFCDKIAAHGDEYHGMRYVDASFVIAHEAPTAGHPAEGVSLPPTLDQAGQEIPASSAARLAGVAEPRMKLSRRFCRRASYADERRYSLYAKLAFCRASSRLRKQFVFRHSARNLLLSDSMQALSVGLPGREKSSDAAHERP